MVCNSQESRFDTGLVMSLVILEAGVVHEQTTTLTDLCSLGYAVLPAALAAEEVRDFRATVLDGLSLMGQTRAIAHSRHLAGFHRFKAFAPIARRLAQNSRVGAVLQAAFAPALPEEIGLTDITVNRSQPWHTDLLRGPYSGFLADCDPWAAGELPCLKVLAYLQPGKSLRLLAGSHLKPTPLDDGAILASIDPASVTQLNLAAGDVVLLDLRTVHRGSTDEEMAEPELADQPKILVSTVYGAAGSPFAQAMRKGNLQRMADWDRKFLPLPDGAS